MPRFAGRHGRDDVAIICRNTTEAINHLAYRLRARAATTSWSRPSSSTTRTCCRGRGPRRAASWSASATARSGPTTCAPRSTPRRAPRLLAITGASNVTGWMPPLDDDHRGRARARRAGRSSTPRSSPRTGRCPRGADFVAFSGHKMYAPFGAGALIGPRAAFATGDPFLAGGGAVDLRRPRRGRVDAAARARGGRLAERRRRRRARRRRCDELLAIGWPAIAAHDDALARALRDGPARRSRACASSARARTSSTLPIATFVVEGVPHALVAARLSAEFAIGVRHGCFCAHPYLVRLLGLGERELAQLPRRRAARRPAPRSPARCAPRPASRRRPATSSACSRPSRRSRAAAPPPVRYVADPHTGDYWPKGLPVPGEPGGLRSPGVAFSGFRDRREGLASRSPAARGGSR